MLRFSLRRQYPIVPLSSKLSKPKFERITPEPRARKNQDPNQIYLYPSNASMHERLRSPICNMFTKARLHTASMHFLTLIDLTILPSYLGNTKKLSRKSILLTPVAWKLRCIRLQIRVRMVATHHRISNEKDLWYVPPRNNVTWIKDRLNEDSSLEMTLAG